MIVSENFIVNGIHFTRTYSDAGRFVVRDGAEYSEACDPASFGRTYTEGNLMPVDEGTLADKAAAYDILTGRTIE